MRATSLRRSYSFYLPTARAQYTRSLTSSTAPLRSGPRLWSPNGRRLLLLATAGAAIGTACAYGIQSSEPILASMAESQERHEEGSSWKEKWRARYNSKIRNWSTPEKIFSVFATVRKDGASFMTLEDFCDAILPADHRQSSAKGKISNVPDFIRFADLNSDSLISFSEFSFFTTLLSLPEEHFRIAFQMFDLNGDGIISKNEFKKIIQVLRAESTLGSQQSTRKKDLEKSRIFSHFFGPDGTKELTYEEFEGFLKSLHQGVQQLEFSRYDAKGRGKISARAFGLSLVGYVDPKDLSSFLNRVETLDDEKAVLTFQDFTNFNVAADKFSELALAVKLYSQGGHIKKKDLNRAVRAISGVELHPVQVDVLFHVLDKDENGKLKPEELEAILSTRQRRGMGHYRDVGVVRFWNCLVGCCSRKAF